MKKKKYAYGTGRNQVVRNYLETPAEAMAENNIAKVKAMEEAESNKLAMGIDLIGNMALQYGAANGGQFGQIFSQAAVAGNQYASMGYGGTTGPGDKTNEKLTAEQTAEVNASTGIEFTEEGANQLFELMTGNSQTETRELNLGKYKGTKYFNVKDQGTDFIVNPTKSNPQNAAGYNKMIKYLKEMNPGVTIANNGYVQFKDRMAYGGTTGSNVEVEGKEVAETIDGTDIKFQGPSHEAGGIDVTLPAGTDVFSDRIKVKGKTMAERQTARKNKLNKLEKNADNKVSKATLKRTDDNLEAQKQKDLEIQEIISNMMNAGKSKAAYGQTGNNGILDLLKGLFTGNQQEGNIDYDGIDKTFENMGISDDASVSGAETLNPKTGNFAPEGNGTTTSPNVSGTFGNTVGLLGNLISSFSPRDTVLKNRATDTPNINAFEDFGNDGLEALEDSKGYIEGQKDSLLKDIDVSSTGAIKRNRNSSRGANTMRANDIAITQGANDSKEKAYNNFARQMMQIISQEAGMENQQDQVVMQGEQDRDLADRQDKDNFYTQLSQAMASMGKGIQQTGKDLNQANQQEMMMDMLQQLSKYGVTFDGNNQLQNPE